MIEIFNKIMRDIAAAVNQWISRFIQNTHDHYLCVLPARPKSLSYFLLKTFFRGINMGTDQTAKMQSLEPDAVLIYATKFKSNFDFMFCHTRYIQDRLRVPEIGLGYHAKIWQPLSKLPRVMVAYLDHLFRHGSLPNPYHRGYIKRELLSGRCAFFSLVEKKGFYQRYVKAAIDPVEYLIDMQRTTERPIYIIPHLMFFGKKPLRSKASLWDILFGTELKPRALRRFVTLLRHTGKIFMEVSEPVSIKEFMAAPENRNRSTIHLSLVLRRQLLVQFNRHRQSITGPVLKSREEIKEGILTNDRLRGVMTQLSKKRDIPLYRVHKEANEYLDEIAANYNNAVIEIGAKIVKWFIGTLFDGFSINNDMVGRIKSMSRRGPLILVPCHKSHIDYLVLSYLMYLNNMPCPHVVAGKNLFFWPLGSFFRAAGAFSVRRSFKGAVLYSKVFAEYLHKLLEEGFNIELFIEGGRSRTGKLLPPQLGFLSILIHAFINQACEDMIFVPIYIGYDRVPEEKAYLHEIVGGSKEPENLKQVIKARRVLRKKYGRIYVRLAEPISLREMLDRQKLSLHDLEQKQISALCRNIGNRMITAIGSATVITPHALTASAILSFSKNRFSLDQVIKQVETLMAYLVFFEVTLSDTLLLDHAQAVEQVMHIYVQRKFLDPGPSQKDAKAVTPLFSINENRRPNLEYYKNNCAGSLAPASYTALLILARDAFQFCTSDLHNGFDFLQNLFGLEFAVDLETTPNDLVGQTIESFVSDAILMPHPSMPDTYNLTSVGFRKLGLFAQLLRPYLESYLVVLYFLLETDRNDISPKDRLKKIQSKGLKMYKAKEIERQESLSKFNFQNAVDFFSSRGIRGAEDAESAKPFLETIKRYIGLMPSL
jgi:glycerol-3-phosphate O-acyltransferase